MSSRPRAHLYALLMALTAATALLGFVREAMIGALFGATRATDAFYAAMTPPFVVAFFLIGGAWAPALTAALAERLARHGHDDGLWLRAVLATAGIGAALAALLAGIAPLTARLLVPGFAADDQRLTADLLVMLLPYGLGTALFLVACAGLNACGRYRTPIVASFVGHAVSVAAIAAFREQGVMAAAWGQSAGAVAAAAIAFLGLRGSPLGHRLTLGVRLPLRDFAVLGVGLAAAGGIDLAERGFASSTAAGTIAILALASKLVHLPMRLVAAPVAAVAFPRLVKGRVNDAAGSADEAGLAGTWIVRILLYCATVAAAAAPPIVAVAFGRGRFDAAAVALLAKALLLLAPAIVAVGVIEYAAKFLLAAERATSAVAAQVGALVVYFVAAFWLRRFELEGLALARSLSWLVAAGWMLHALHRSDRRMALFPRPLRTLLAIGVAAAAVAASIAWIPGGNLVRLATAAIAAAGLYFGCLLLPRPQAA